MIWGILLLAFFLRLVTLNQSLWLDEAINVLAAKNLSWFDFVAKYPIGDFHPPGYFALLWPWTRIFGFSEIAVRMPSVIFGVGTVYFTYLLGGRIFEKKVALLAALFLAVGPLHVFYSQEARMYSLAAFSVALSFHFFLELIKNKKWSAFGFVMSMVLVLYSDYVAYFIIPAQIAFVFSYKRELIKKYISLVGISALFLLPWLPVFLQQFSIGKSASELSPGWKAVVGGVELKSLALIWVKTLVGRISFTDKALYAGVLGGLSILWGLGVVRGLHIRLLSFWILFPVLFAWGVSFFVPVLSYFRMVFILPAFYLLAAFGFSRLPKNVFKISVLLGVLSSITFLSIYYTNPKFQREDWRGAVKFMENKIDDGSVVLFESNTLFSPYMFYTQSYKNVSAGLSRIPARSVDDVRLETILNGKNQAFLFEYLVEITDPGRFLEKELENKGFKKSQVYDFSGVGFVTLYSRL